MGRLSLYLAITALAALQLCTRALKAEAPSSLAGTWFGSIVLTEPNGKVSHDTAVLVVDRTEGHTRGGMGRTIDQLTPWTDGVVRDNQLLFHLEAAGGLQVTLARANEGLTGNAIGNTTTAHIDLRPAPGLLTHDLLQREITRADQQLYTAFETCDVNGYAALLSPDLEFYQDHTGKTNYQANLQSLRERCAEGIRLRRALDQASLVVDAAPGFGAIEAGTHRFYRKQPNGTEQLDAIARFTNVWSKIGGTWKLVRVISYDHH